MLLTYCSGAAEVMREAPGLVTVPVPAALTVTPVLSLVVLKDSPAADRLVIFMLSERGQAISASYGFKPVSEP